MKFLGHNILSEVMYLKSVETVTYVSHDYGCKRSILCSIHDCCL